MIGISLWLNARKFMVSFPLYLRKEDVSRPVLPVSVTMVLPSGNSVTDESPWPTSRKVTLSSFFSGTVRKRYITMGMNGTKSRYFLLLNRRYKINPA